MWLKFASLTNQVEQLNPREVDMVMYLLLSVIYYSILRMLIVVCQQCCLQTLWNLQHKALPNLWVGLELPESTIEGSILVLILFISFNADVPEDAENIERNEHEQSGIGDSILQEKADNDPFREVSAENMPAKMNRGPLSCP